MELTKREKTIKYVVYFLVLVLGAMLQNIAGLWLEIGSARCFFLVPLALLISLNEDEIVASIIGLVAGMMLDIVSVSNMCFNGIFMMLVCYFMAVLLSHLLRGTYWVGVVSGIVATLLYVVLYWLLFVMTKGGEGAGMTFLTFYLPSFVYTSVMTVVMNLAIVQLKKRLNRE